MERKKNENIGIELINVMNENKAFLIQLQLSLQNLIYTIFLIYQILSFQNLSISALKIKAV